MVSPDQFYASQKRRAEATTILARREWRKMVTLDDWGRIASRVTMIVAASQLGAARDGVAYVDSLDVEPDAAVRPQSLAGVASDMRPLDTLLYSAVVHGRVGGWPDEAARLASGLRWLNMLVRTQVADAGRAATSLGITARPDVGYYRMVSPPCCQLCAVQAGKWFRWNAGFKRHPGCDCRHSPAGEGDPPDGYRSEIPPDQIHDLTQAQRDALAEGADLGRVVNAYRAGYDRGKLPDKMSDLTSVRKGASRLTPEGIYKRATSRAHAVELLKQHGYLTDLS